MGNCGSALCGSGSNSAEVIFTCSLIEKEGDLYDYFEKKLISIQKVVTSKPGFLVKEGKKVSFYEKAMLQKIPVDAAILLEISITGDKISFHHPPNLEKENLLDPKVTIKKAPWLSARAMSNEKGFIGRKLHEEDVIRFGKVQFIIKKLSAVGNADKEDDYTVRARSRRSTLKRREGVTWESVNNLSGENTPVASPRNGLVGSLANLGEESARNRENVKALERFSVALGQGSDNAKPTCLAENSPEQKQQRVCRICLCEEDDANDPIVPPCKCSGTMREVHVKCFKKWLSRHVISRESVNMYSIVWDNLKCELCSHEVENFIEIGGKRFELIEFPKIATPHVALEYYVGGKSKGYHILKYNQEKTAITFGRATESHLRVNDSTVSRFHAAINLVNGSFYLQDLQSKYGTSILVDEPETLVDEHNGHFILEVGRVLVECQVRGMVKRTNINKKGKSKKNLKGAYNDQMVVEIKKSQLEAPGQKSNPPSAENITLNQQDILSQKKQEGRESSEIKANQISGAVNKNENLNVQFANPPQQGIQINQKLEENRNEGEAEEIKIDHAPDTNNNNQNKYIEIQENKHPQLKNSNDAAGEKDGIHFSTKNKEIEIGKGTGDH